MPTYIASPADQYRFISLPSNGGGGMRLPIERGRSLVTSTPVAALEPLLAFVCLWALVGVWKLARRLGHAEETLV